MKIIGKTKDGFIVDMTSNELANLVGYYSKYSSEFQQEHENLNVGEEIQISKIYKQLYSLSFAENEISKIRKILYDAYENLEIVNPFIEKIKKESEENNENRGKSRSYTKC